MKASRALLATLCIAVFSGCDYFVPELACNGLREAIALHQPRHPELGGAKAIQKDQFLNAQKAVLAAHKVRVPSRIPDDPIKQCTGTLRTIRKAEPTVSMEKLAVEILAAYAQSWDPHSLTVDETNAIPKYRRTDFGLTVEWTGGAGAQLVVTDVISNSPADLARLRTGMVVQAINRTLPESLGAEQVARLLDPEKNEKVVITVLGREITLERDAYRVAAFEPSTLAGNIGYIRVRHFVGGAEAFNIALRNVEDTSALILDLRQVAGGSLPDVLKIGNCLLSQGGPFAGLRPNATSGTTEALPLEPGSIWDGPIVVLVSASTKSAAEILAGALQDYGAIVVGERTFGKGTVQKQFALSPFGLPGGLEMTTAFSIRPSGRPIQVAGIMPDVPLPRLMDPQRETAYAGYLLPPLLQPALPGYDTSTLPNSGAIFRRRLHQITRDLKDLVARQALGPSWDIQILEASRRVAQFIVAETDQEAQLDLPTEEGFQGDAKQFSTLPMPVAPN